MRIISRPRGAGKTSEMIRMSAETGCYIVAKDHHTARYTADLANKMELQIPFPLTFKEFLDRRWSPRIKGFLLDDVELLLLHILPHDASIEAMTISTGHVYGPDGLRESISVAGLDAGSQPSKEQVDELLRGWMQYFLKMGVIESEWVSEFHAVMRARIFQGDPSLDAPVKPNDRDTTVDTTTGA